MYGLWQKWHGDYAYYWTLPLAAALVIPALFIVLTTLRGGSRFLWWSMSLSVAVLGLAGSLLLFFGKPLSVPGTDRDGQLLQALAEGPSGIARLRRLEGRSRWGLALISSSFLMECIRLLYLRP